MAKIRDYAITISTALTASLVCEMPTHETGDLLIAFLNKDSTTGFAGTGWNLHRSQDSAGANGEIWTKRATSASETITFTLTSETCLAVIVAVKNVEAVVDSGAGALTINVVAAGGTFTRTTGSFDTNGFTAGQSVVMSGFTNAGNNGVKIITSITGTGTIMTVTSEATLVNESGDNNERVISTGADGSAKTGADDLTFPLSGATLTPVQNNCLIFNWLSTDIGIGPSALPGWVNIFTGDTGVNSGCLSYSYQKTAASITHSGHWGGVTSTAADSRAFAIAIRDNGSQTEVDPYVDRTTVGATIVSSLVGVTGEIDAGTWATTVLSLATVGAKSTTFDAIATVVDSGYIPFWSSASFTPATSTTNLVGSELGLTTAADMQTGSPLLFGTWNFATPRDYVDLGKAATGGLVIAIADSTNDYKAWVIGGQFDKTTNPDKRNKYAIQVNQTTDTTYGASGILNNVNKVLFLAAGVYGAVAWRGSNLWLLTTTILAGGSATTPLNFEQMEIAVNDGTGRIPIFDRDGSAATIWTRLRVGGGDPVHYSIDAKTFQWPRVADEIDFFSFHVDVDTVGIEFYGQAGDTIHFTTCTFSSSTSYYWRINSAASASASWDFSGTTVVGATVTLRPVFTFTSMTFSDCSEIVLNGADLANCTLKNQRPGNNFGAVAFTSATEANGVTSCTFTDNNDGDLGHSIRITAAGTYTFDGHTFSGGGVAERSFNTSSSGVDGTNEYVTTDANHGYTDGDAVYYQKQGGTQTIGLTDGTLYYVNSINATQLSFHTTKAAAIAGTPKVDLTASGSETHYIYSAKADVYNNSGGAVTINITNGGTTPTIRESNGSSTTVQNTVTLNVNNPNSSFVGARVTIFANSGGPETEGTVLMLEEAINDAGVYRATQAHNFLGNQPVTIRARLTGFIPFETTDTITNNGLNVTAIWQVDSIVN